MTAFSEQRGSRSRRTHSLPLGDRTEPGTAVTGWLLRRVPWVSAVFALACFASGCLTPWRHGIPDVYRRVRQASVEILADGRLQGSGWFADAEGYLVTAAHVVKMHNPALLEGRWADGQLRAPVEVIAMDWANDLALLKLRGASRVYPCLEVAAGTPEPGEDVFLFGAPLFRHDIMVGGRVAKSRTTFDYFADRGMYMRSYTVTAPSPPGTSGGAWVDARGRVVGTQSGFHNWQGGLSGIAIVSTPDAIRRLLRTRQSVVRASLGCGLEELWTQSPGFIARFSEGTEGVITIPVEEGGAVALAGLGRESLIVAVGGSPVRYREEVFGIVYGKRPGDVLTLSVLQPDTAQPHEVRVKLGALEWPESAASE